MITENRQNTIVLTCTCDVCKKTKHKESFNLKVYKRTADVKALFDMHLKRKGWTVENGEYMCKKCGEQ